MKGSCWSTAHAFQLLNRLTTLHNARHLCAPVSINIYREAPLDSSSKEDASYPLMKAQPKAATSP